jgi:TonB family protein
LKDFWRKLEQWIVAGACCSLLCSAASLGQSGRVRKKPETVSPSTTEADANAANKQKPAREPEIVDGPNGKETIYRSREVSKPAVVLKQPNPHYPHPERHPRRNVLVVLSVVFSATGLVTNIRVLLGEKEFDESAIEAAKQIKFEPAIKDGKPVATRKRLEYRFYN